MLKRYRIVRDKYLGFEVQVWRLWWPFWAQCDFTNTHRTIAEAEAWARSHSNGHVVKSLKF